MSEKDALNGRKQVDYEAVMEVKWRVTREVFDKNHDAILRRRGFLDFLKRNRDWVLDYAIFSVKRDEFGTADFSEWGEWAEYDSKKAESLSISTEVMYYVWLQYELDRQLSDAVAHLHAAGRGAQGRPADRHRPRVGGCVGRAAPFQDGRRPARRRTPSR